MDTGPPIEYHLQDWAIIAEALVQWAGNPNKLETPREERAYELVEEIAAEIGISPSTLIKQVDDELVGL